MIPAIRRLASDSVVCVFLIIAYASHGQSANDILDKCLSQSLTGKPGHFVFTYSCPDLQIFPEEGTLYYKWNNPLENERLGPTGFASHPWLITQADWAQHGNGVVWSTRARLDRYRREIRELAEVTTEVAQYAEELYAFKKGLSSFLFPIVGIEVLHKSISVALE